MAINDVAGEKGYVMYEIFFVNFSVIICAQSSYITLKPKKI